MPKSNPNPSLETERQKSCRKIIRSSYIGIWNKYQRSINGVGIHKQNGISCATNHFVPENTM